MNDGASRGIPAQDLPENQDPTVRFMTMELDGAVHAVDDKGEVGDKVDGSPATPHSPIIKEDSKETPADVAAVKAKAARKPKEDPGAAKGAGE